MSYEDQGSSPSPGPGPSTVKATILGKLKYISETVAYYTGMASQTPPSSQEPPTNTQTPPAIPEPSSQASDTNPADEELEVERISPAEERARHAAEMLSNHGVKVRDYAYESKLPPVRTAVIVIPTTERYLKRNRNVYDTQDAANAYPMPYVRQPAMAMRAGPSKQKQDQTDGGHRSPKRRKTLQRKVTEPVEQSQSQPASQNPDFGDATLSDLDGPTVFDRERTPVAAWRESTPLAREQTPLATPFNRGDTPLVEFEPTDPAEYEEWARNCRAQLRDRGANSWAIFDVEPVGYVKTPLITPEASLNDFSWFSGSSLTSLAESQHPDMEDSQQFGTLSFVPARHSLQRSISVVITPRASMHMDSGDAMNVDATPLSPALSQISHASHASGQSRASQVFIPSTPSTPSLVREPSMHSIPPSVSQPQTPYQLRPRVVPATPSSTSRKTSPRVARHKRSMLKDRSVSVSARLRHKASKTRSSTAKKASEIMKPTKPRRSLRTKKVAQAKVTLTR